MPPLAGIAITVFFAALAVFHQFYGKIDAIGISLLLLAALPWLIPFLAPYVSTLKVAGMEVSLREMKKQVEESKQIAAATASALVTGVGRAPNAAADTGLVSHGVPMPAREGGEENTDIAGPAEAAGRRLSAEVKPLPGAEGLFLVHLSVAASLGARPLPDGTVVTFHLHPTFAQPIVQVEANAGLATLDRIAWGAFVASADVEGTRLALNLAELPAAPELFRRR